MRRLFTILIFIALVIGIVSCASKRLTKKAIKHEQAGLYSDAAELYSQALMKNKDNIDAKLGLKKTGQFVLDDKLSKFNIAYNSNNVKEAVYNFIEAENYYQKTINVGVDLLFPNHYREYYNEVKNEHLNTQYKEGIKYLNEDNFQEAEKIFTAILKLEANYKDVKKLQLEAKYEPVYREAENNMAAKKYRTAYKLYTEILQNAGQYKNCTALKEDALEMGLVTIALIPFSNNTKRRSLDDIVSSKCESAISKLQNPFIKVIDRSNTDRIIKEQELNLSGITSNSSNIDVGKILGAKAFLYGEITHFSEKNGNLIKETKTGYLKKEIQYTDPATKAVTTRTEYDKVTYFEYSQTNSSQISFTYKLISTETGEILLTDMFSEVIKDEIYYARYDGESKKLVPGFWKYNNKVSSEDKIKDVSKDVNRLQSLLKANSQIKTTEILDNELVEKLAIDVATKIDKFNPEN